RRRSAAPQRITTCWMDSSSGPQWAADRRRPWTFSWTEPRMGTPSRPSGPGARWPNSDRGCARSARRLIATERALLEREADRQHDPAVARRMAHVRRWNPLRTWRIRDAGRSIDDDQVRGGAVDLLIEADGLQIAPLLRVRQQ